MGKSRTIGTVVGGMLTVAALAGCAGAASSAESPPRATATATPTATVIPTATPGASPDTTQSPVSAWKIGPNGECDAGQLDFSLQSRPMDSGMSQFYWNLQLTNTSDEACTLTGYPQVRLVNSLTGADAGAANGRESGAGQSEGVVEMPPGASAYSVLHFAQAGVYDCPIVPVNELAVTPPYWDLSRAVPTPNEIDGCDDRSTELVRVGPLTATVPE